jgi:hypothetical protein
VSDIWVDIHKTQEINNLLKLSFNRPYPVNVYPKVIWSAWYGKDSGTILRVLTEYLCLQFVLQIVLSQGDIGMGSGERKTHNKE